MKYLGVEIIILKIFLKQSFSLKVIQVHFFIQFIDNQIVDKTKVYFQKRFKRERKIKGYKDFKIGKTPFTLSCVDDILELREGLII